MAKLLGHEITTTAELEAHAAEVEQKLQSLEQGAMDRILEVEARLSKAVAHLRLTLIVVGLAFAAVVALAVFH